MLENAPPFETCVTLVQFSNMLHIFFKHASKKSIDHYITFFSDKKTTIMNTRNRKNFDTPSADIAQKVQTNKNNNPKSGELSDSEKSDISDSSHPHKKRKDVPTVSPGDRKNLSQKQIESWYPNKLLKASKYFTNYDGQSPVLDTLKTPPSVLYAKDIGYGMLTAFYIDSFNKKSEGNVFPILKAHGAVRGYDHLTQKDHQFVADVGFLSLSSRRVGKHDNSPVYKAKYNDAATKYKQVVFLKAFNNNDSRNKHRIADLIVKVRKQPTKKKN